MGPGMMHGWGFGFLGWVGMILMWIFPIGLLALVILGVFKLVRRVSVGKQLPPDPNRQLSAPASPREILQVRYARGEITREQYTQMMDDLS